MSVQDEIAIPLRNQLLEIERVSRIVDAFGAAHAVSPDVILCVNLALDEIITNIIAYAYDDAREHEIAARVRIDAADIVVEVEDDGRAFNPLEFPTVDVTARAASVDHLPVGGLGIHVVRQVMDGVAYRREGGRNILVVRKALS